MLPIPAFLRTSRLFLHALPASALLLPLAAAAPLEKPSAIAQRGFEISVGAPTDASVPAKTGFYLYQAPPESEALPRPVSFADGMLTDGDDHTLVSWPGKGAGPVALTMVFDVQEDVAIHAVKLNSRIPNEFWGIDSITIETRASEDSQYRLFGRIEKPDTGWASIAIPGAKASGRYVRIKLRRAHEYVYIGLSEVRIFKARSLLPLEPTENLAAEFAIGTRGGAH